MSVEDAVVAMLACCSSLFLFAFVEGFSLFGVADLGLAGAHFGRLVGAGFGVLDATEDGILAGWVAGGRESLEPELEEADVSVLGFVVDVFRDFPADIWEL